MTVTKKPLPKKKAATPASPAGYSDDWDRIVEVTVRVRLSKKSRRVHPPHFTALREAVVAFIRGRLEAHDPGYVVESITSRAYYGYSMDV